MDIAELAILLTAKIDDLQEKMETAKKVTSSFANHGKGANSILSESFGSLATKIFSTVAILQTINKAFIDTVRVSSQFESAMKEVEHSTGATADQLALLAEYAKKAGTAYGVTGPEMAKAMVILGQEGIKTAYEMQDVLIPALQMATVTEISTSQATNILTNTINRFHLDMKDAAHLAGIYAEAHDKVGISANQLESSMRLLAPIVNLNGQRFDDVVAVLSAVKKSLGDVSSATMGYRTLMTQMGGAIDESGVATNKLGKELIQAGVSHTQLALAMKNPIEAINLLKTAHISGADAVQIFGNRLGPAVATLMQTSDVAAGLSKNFRGIKDAAADAASDLDTIEGRSKILNATWTEFQLTLGSCVVPALKMVLAAFLPLLRSIIDNKQFMDALLTVVQWTAKGFAILAGAIDGAHGTIELFGAAVKLMKGDVKGSFEAGSKAVKDLADNAYATKKSLADLDAAFKRNGEAAKAFAEMCIQSSEDVKQGINSEVAAAKDAADKKSEFIEKLKLKVLEMEGDKLTILKAKQQEEFDSYAEKINKNSPIMQALKLAYAKQLIEEEAKLKAQADINLLQAQDKVLEALELKQQQEYNDYKKTTNDKVLLAKFAATQKIQYEHQIAIESKKRIQGVLTDEKVDAEARLMLLKDWVKGHQLSADQRVQAEQEAQNLMNKMQQDTVNKYNAMVTGPLTDALAVYFKALKDGTANAQMFWDTLAKGMAKAMLKAISQIAQAKLVLAIGSMDIPGIAAMTVAVSTLEALATSLANGGIVSKPTLAMVGDNPRSPEVVAPLDKLAEMMQPRVTSSGNQMQEPTKQTGNTTINLAFEYKPQIGLGSPSEMRNAAQTIIRALQDYGYGVAR